MNPKRLKPIASIAYISAVLVPGAALVVGGLHAVGGKVGEARSWLYLGILGAVGASALQNRFENADKRSGRLIRLYLGTALFLLLLGLMVVHSARPLPWPSHPPFADSPPFSLSR